MICVLNKGASAPFFAEVQRLWTDMPVPLLSYIKGHGVDIYAPDKISTVTGDPNDDCADAVAIAFFKLLIFPEFSKDIDGNFSAIQPLLVDHLHEVVHLIDAFEGNLRDDDDYMETYARELKIIYDDKEVWPKFVSDFGYYLPRQGHLDHGRIESFAQLGAEYMIGVPTDKPGTLSAMMPDSQAAVGRKIKKVIPGLSPLDFICSKRTTGAPVRQIQNRPLTPNT